jgi:CheY-like chemotaxis protein
MSVKIVPQYTEGESAGKGFKILVAEDEPIAQEFLSIILKNFKLNIEIASDGREVIEKVKKDPYDLILMDLQMPVMGGVEVTRIIREQLHKTMPILALTATEDDKEKCLAAGMNDYLTKPIEVSELKDKIFYWLKGVSRVGPVNRKEKRAMKWDKQRAIRELGIPEGFYRELVFGFMKQSTSAIQDLEKALQDRNFEEVAKAAHFIRGSAGNLRIEEIYVTAKELETVAKGDHDAGVIEKQMGSLKNAMGELEKNI